MVSLPRTDQRQFVRGKRKGDCGWREAPVSDNGRAHAIPASVRTDITHKLELFSILMEISIQSFVCSKTIGTCGQHYSIPELGTVCRPLLSSLCNGVSIQIRILLWSTIIHGSSIAASVPVTLNKNRECRWLKMVNIQPNPILPPTPTDAAAPRKCA